MPTNPVHPNEIETKVGNSALSNGRHLAGIPSSPLGDEPEVGPCTVAVLWIDWYAYHVSRFKGLVDHPLLNGAVAGLEMVGGTGVHRGLKFREEIPSELPVKTMFPTGDWDGIPKWKMSLALWNQLNRLSPSVVLVPGYYNLPALAMAAWARVKGKRSVLMTESTEGDHNRVWWRELFKKVLIRSLFGWAIAGGKAHRRYLERLGFRQNGLGAFMTLSTTSIFGNVRKWSGYAIGPRNADCPSATFFS